MNLSIIRTDRPFFLYGLVTVEYNGRAKSIIGPVNLSVMSKKDGSFVIHAAKNIAAANYQGPKSTLTVDGDTLICVNRKKTESIKVKIHKLKQYNELDDWTMNSISISRTEKELCEKIVSNITKILVNCGFNYADIETHHQFPTKFGPVDVCAIGDCNTYHIIEAKARKITMAAVFQLERYLSCFDSCVGHLIAPSISPKAQLALRTKPNIHYTELTY